MAEDSSYVHKPNLRELPIATRDIAGILFRCYQDQLVVEEAVLECKRFGAKDVGSEQVEDAYRELRALAERLNKKFAAYLQRNDETGGE